MNRKLGLGSKLLLYLALPPLYAVGEPGDTRSQSRPQDQMRALQVNVPGEE